MGKELTVGLSALIFCRCQQVRYCSGQLGILCFLECQHRAQNFIYNGKFRHVRHRHNTVKQLLSNGIISIDFVSSKDNLADPLTKGLSGERIN